MGSDSAFGEPYYGDALRQDNEQKWSALAAARREAEALVAALSSPPAAPARDEVREAAEVIRTILTAHDARLSESGVLTYGPPSKGTGFVAAIQWLRRYDAARGGE